MSHTFTRPRGERAARWLTGILLVAAVLGAVIAVNTALPSAWWPRTGQAFATEPTPPLDPAQEEACDLIVGPAHAFCLQAGQQGTPQAAEVPAPGSPRRSAIAIPALSFAAFAVLTGALVLRHRRTR